MVLEKLPDGSAVTEFPDYMLAKASGIGGAAGDLERELNLSAFNGFRAVPHGAFLQTEYKQSDPFLDFLVAMTKKDHQIERSTIIFKSVYVLMQRGSDRSIKCHYLVPRTDFHLENKKAKQALAERRRMVAAVAADGVFFGPDLFLVMERCGGSFSEAAKAPAEPNPKPLQAKYLVLNTYDSAKAQRELDKAVARGYRPLFSEGGLLALILVTEKSTSQSTHSDFRIVSERDASSFESALNSSPALRIMGNTMSVTEKVRENSRRLFVVLEKTEEGSPSFHYRVLVDRNSGSSKLQDEVNAASELGYRVMGVTDDASGTTVVMERSLENPTN